MKDNKGDISLQNTPSSLKEAKQARHILSTFETG